MKCLTVCQPHAHLLIRGQKPIENRSWPTRFRGELLVHAGVNRSWLRAAYDDPRIRPMLPLVDRMTFGAIIGRVTVYDCLPLADLPAELRDNPFAWGPWCWLVRDPVAFANSIPYRGRQQLFDVPDEIVRAA